MRVWVCESVCNEKLVGNLNNLFICYVVVAACRQRIRGQTRSSNANLISPRVYQIVICLQLNFLNTKCVFPFSPSLSLPLLSSPHRLFFWAEQTNLSTNLFGQARGADQIEHFCWQRAAAKRQTIFIIYLLCLQLYRKCHKNCWMHGEGDFRFFRMKTTFEVNQVLRIASLGLSSTQVDFGQ